jgi:subtilisin family serine protease
MAIRLRVPEMELPGRLLLVLKPGEGLPNVPAHLDYVLDAARPVARLDRPLDQVLNDAGGFRALGTYHAAASLGVAGQQNLGWSDAEERLGLSRSYRIQIADPECTQETIERLRALPTVESVSVQTLTTVSFGTLALRAPEIVAGSIPEDAWRSHEMVQAREAHALEPGDDDIWVGLVDTGISLGHPEFQRKLLAGYSTVKLPLGATVGDFRVIGGDPDDEFAPRDRVDHGSHVAGVVGAHGWNQPLGVAGGAMLLPIRVLAAASRPGLSKRMGVGALPDINEGMKVAVDLGADCINMSFGTPASVVGDGPPPHQEVVSYAALQGCTLVAAMGNSGKEEVYWPAGFPEVISVGSVDYRGARSSFSTYGNHISLCAPGEQIFGAVRRGYSVGSGTSYAAPFAAGAAALLMARSKRKNRKLVGAEVKRLLMESALPLSGGFNPETGAGLLNIKAALDLLDRSLASPNPPGKPS